MSVSVQPIPSEANEPIIQAPQFLEDCENLNEDAINLVASAVKNSENLDQFLEQYNSATKPKGTFGIITEPHTATGSPNRQLVFSATKFPQSALSSKAWDPMQYINSSDEEECTFQPEINTNAGHLAKRIERAGDTNEILYQDALERRIKHQEYLEIDHDNREKIATISKIRPKSVQMVIKKLQRALKSLVEGAEESETPDSLTFEGLGTVLFRLGLFQNIEFKPKSEEVERSSMSINHAKVKPERLSKEIFFHENLWKICSLAASKTDLIPSELVFKFLMILVEEKCPVSDSASLLLEVMTVALKKIGIESEPVPEGEEEGQEENSAFEKLREEKKLWNLEKVVAEFRRLFDNKTSFMAIYQAANLISGRPTLELEGQNNGFSFAPKVNKKSKKLDSNYFNKTVTKVIGESVSEPNVKKFFLKNRHHRLHSYAKYLQEKKGATLEAQIAEELLPCTFSPKVSTFKRKNKDQNRASLSPSRVNYYDQVQASHPNADRHSILYESAKVYKERLQQKSYNFKKSEEIKELSPCTFQPNLNRNYDLSPQRETHFYVGVPNGFKRVVERLHKGDQMRLTKISQQETIPRGENYERNRNLDFTPPTFLTRPKIRRQDVLVYVDVSIGPGRTGRIGIHRGDNAKTLAKNFARTYSLNLNMRASLEKLLQSYIDSYFAHPDHEEAINERGDEHEEEEEEEDEEEIAEGEEYEEEDEENEQ